MNYISNKFNILKFGYIPLFFVFLPTLAIAFGSKPILVFFIAITAFTILSFVFLRNFYLYHFCYLYKYTPFKFIVWWALWVILSGFILVLMGKYSFFHYIYYLILYLFINMIFTLILPTIMVTNKKSLQKIVKFILSLSYAVLLLGILNFFCTVFDISIINSFFNIINNSRIISGGAGTVQSYVGKVYSVFAEPGWFGGFVGFILPIAYFISKSKYKLYNNGYLNIIIKKSFVPLILVNTLLTHSPIWLIINFGIYIFLFFKSHVKQISKNRIKLFILSFFIIFVITITPIFITKINNSIDVESGNDVKYLSRISYTIKAIQKQDYLLFAQNEASLASRINSYINSLRIFKDNPILGIGLGNSKFYMSYYFETSPVPLTIENYLCLSKSKSDKGTQFNSALVYELLSETGLVGFLLFFSFLIKMRSQLKNSINYYENSILYDFILGLKLSLLFLLFVFSLYDWGLSFIHLWIFIGVGIAVINVTKHYRYIGVKNE